MARPSGKRQKTKPSDVEDKALQSSSDPVAEDMLKSARSAHSSSEKRRALKRKAIEKKLDKKTENIAARINALFEARKDRVTKLQVSQWDRLEALNKRRAHLESLILSSMRSIELHTTNVSTELSAMFKGRIEEIQESPAVPKP